MIQITFYLPELDSAYQIHPLNGLYPKKNCEKPKIHPKGTIFINPFDQGTNQNQFGITVNPAHTVLEKFKSEVLPKYIYLNYHEAEKYWQISDEEKYKLSQSNIEIGTKQDTAADGVIDGLLIKEYVKHPFLAERIQPYVHFEKIRNGKDSIRKMNAHMIDSLFQPFFVSQTELSNLEFHEFRQYLIDSILMNHLLIHTKDEHFHLLLDIPEKKAKKLSIKNRNQLIEKYGLKNLSLLVNNPDIFDYLKGFYYPQPESYYKRRTLDPRKFYFRFPNGDSISTLIDTLCFTRVPNFLHDGSAMHMYFWHPLYYNYPIQGISYEQLKAYCHWKEHQINRNRKKGEAYFKVNLISILQAQFVAKSCVNEGKDWIYCRDSNRYISYLHEEYVIQNKFSPEICETCSNEKRNEQIYGLKGNVSEISGTEIIENGKVKVLLLGGNFIEDVFYKGDGQLNTFLCTQTIGTNQLRAGWGARIVFTVVRLD